MNVGFDKVPNESRVGIPKDKQEKGCQETQTRFTVLTNR